MKRRDVLTRAGALLMGTVAGYAGSQAAPLRIRVTASKFEFTPSEIVVRKGERVTLLLASVDFAHGFSLPDFKLRRDLVPGKEVELTFTPDNAGRFHAICDNFCGDGHDDMSAWLVVTA